MLSPDLPIAKLEEDGLNRGSFAESLAKTLVQYSFPSSLTIGLYGEWGSGKTSLLNMVFENVERIDDGVVVLRFNPWLCSDPKQLVTQFFKQMATAIKLKKRAADKAWELIDQYADILGATSVIPVAGEIVAAFTKVLTKKAEEETKEQTNDLQESKNQIIPGESMSLGDIDRAMEGLGQQFNDLLRKAADANNADNYTAQFQSISTAMAEFKRRKAMILQIRQEQEQTNRRVQAVASVLKTASSELTEWDDNVVYQLLERVTVLSRERIRVTLRDGLEIEQTVEQPKRRKFACFI